jgi:hypothetical protein
MKTRNIIYLLTCCFLWLVTACGKKLVLPSAENRKIVLLGELVADESMHIRAGISTVVQSGAMINEELIQNLSITIKDNTNNTTPLSGTEDDLSIIEHTVSFSSEQLIQTGNKYEITASHPELGTALANVIIPNAFNAIITDTLSTEYNGESCLQMNIQIADNTEQNFYVVEVLQQPFSVEDAFLFNGRWLKKSENFITYDSLINAGVTVEEKPDTFYIQMQNRVTFYTTDAQSEHLLNGNNKTLCRRVLLYDKTFNGNTHQSSILLPKSWFGMSGYMTLIQVKSVAEDYFLYLKGYEQYDPSSGFSNTNAPVRLAGNITNGVGMIGGVFKREFKYLF